MRSIAAFLGGLLIMGLNVCNAQLSTETNIYVSCAIYHLVGLILCTLMASFSHPVSTSKPPFHYYFAGLFSVLTILVCNVCILSIGAALTVSLSLVGQLLTSACIDHFGWFGRTAFPLNSQRSWGVMVMIAGALIMGGGSF